MKNYLEVLKRDGDIKPYRPELRPICGSVTATILLQQIIFWWNKAGGKFYKFKEPNNHELYKKGDSWLEELAFGEKEFTAAIRNIGFKRGKGVVGQVPKTEKEALVVYYTDKDRLTWYILNEELLEKHLENVYQITPNMSVTKLTPKSGVTTTIAEITTERGSLSKPEGLQKHPPKEVKKYNWQSMSLKNQILLLRSIMTITGFTDVDASAMIDRLKKSGGENKLEIAYRWLYKDVVDGKLSAAYFDFTSWGGEIVNKMPASFQEAEKLMQDRLEALEKQNPGFIKSKQQESPDYDF